MHALPLAAVLSGALLYAAGAARRGRTVASTGRVTAFALACGALGVALLSPLERWADSLFWAHMIQHQLLMVVAAPLLAVSRPVSVSLGVLPSAGRRGMARWWRASRLDRLRSLIARPSIAALAFGIVLWTWHMPALYQAALDNETVHMIEHASFFGAGVLFWSTLLRRRADAGLATVYLFTTAAHAGLLGVLLTLAGRPWYPSQTGAEAWGLTPLEDQQVAGLVMWVPSGLTFAVAGLVLVACWLREAGRRVSVSTSESLARASRRAPR